MGKQNSMSAAPTLEECKAFLQRPSGSGNGGTVFNHVAEILLKLVEERPANPVDVFEEVSAAVKQSAYNAIDAPLRPSYQDHPSIQWARSTVEQLRIKGPGEDQSVGKDQGCNVQNLAEDALLFEMAGIGINTHQAAALATGLRKLAEKEPLKSVRFWGKITGTQRDYWVAECQYKNPSDFEPAPKEATESKATSSFKPGEPPEAEKMGEGLNKYVYFVVGYELDTDGIFGNYTYDKWIKLPPVRPEYIIAAKKIKKMFTGCLDAPVNAYPPFPGSEAEYLVAQINRITRGATMTMNGLWAVEEVEEGEETYKQVRKAIDGDAPYEVKKTGYEGLANPETYKADWVHHPEYPSILSKGTGAGRCSYVPPPLDEEGNPIEDPDEDKEEAEPDNKTIEEESNVYGEVPSHSVRLAVPKLGDFSPAVLRSNRWIGAYTIAYETTDLNVYVGDGLKFGPEPFQILMPPVLPAECSELMPSEEGSDEPGPPREGMQEQLDEAMPDPFLVVDATAEEGEGDEA